MSAKRLTIHNDLAMYMPNKGRERMLNSSECNYYTYRSYAIQAETHERFMHNIREMLFRVRRMDSDVIDFMTSMPYPGEKGYQS